MAYSARSRSRSGTSWVNRSRAALLASKAAEIRDCWLSAAGFMCLDCSQVHLPISSGSYAPHLL